MKGEGEEEEAHELQRPWWEHRLGGSLVSSNSFWTSDGITPNSQVLECWNQVAVICSSQGLVGTQLLSSWHRQELRCHCCGWKDSVTVS